MRWARRDDQRLQVWVDTQLNPAAIPDADCDWRLANSGFTTLNKTLDPALGRARAGQPALGRAHAAVLGDAARHLHPRRVQPAPAQGSAGRLLAQPLQRVRRRRHPGPGVRALRPRRDPRQHAGQLPDDARSGGPQHGHDVHARQLHELGGRPQRELRARAVRAAHDGRRELPGRHAPGRRARGQPGPADRLRGRGRVRGHPLLHRLVGGQRPERSAQHGRVPLPGQLARPLPEARAQGLHPPGPARPRGRQHGARHAGRAPGHRPLRLPQAVPPADRRHAQPGDGGRGGAGLLRPARGARPAPAGRAGDPAVGRVPRHLGHEGEAPLRAGGERHARGGARSSRSSSATATPTTSSGSTGTPASSSSAAAAPTGIPTSGRSGWCPTRAWGAGGCARGS